MTTQTLEQQIKYDPRDFPAQKTPAVFETPFADTLGKQEYESIAATLLSVSQGAGKWTGVPMSSFRSPMAVVGMQKAGYVSIQNGVAYLNSEAINLIGDRYVRKD